MPVLGQQLAGLLTISQLIGFVVSFAILTLAGLAFTWAVLWKGVAPAA